MDLVFTAGSSNGAVQCIDVVIINSPMVEEDEIFTVILTTTSSVVLLGNYVTTINVTYTESMSFLVREIYRVHLTYVQYIPHTCTPLMSHYKRIQTLVHTVDTYIKCMTMTYYDL